MTDISDTAAETLENRLKRLRIRSWRRGMREMDLLLGGYADGALADLDGAALDAYERLLEEPDQELYLWVSGAKDPDPAHVPTIAAIQGFHNIA